MNITLPGGARHGTVCAVASKSAGHRLLLCAAFGGAETLIRCGAVSRDIAATIECLRALGARIEETEPGMMRVTPIAAAPDGVCELRCGESGSTLRFLLPMVGALGAKTVFLREGRLPERPLAPLDAVLNAHGMNIREDSVKLYCEGKLLAGDYAISGDVSSQFVTGLLLALPLLRGESTLTVNGTAVSAPYIDMTEETLRLAKTDFSKSQNRYMIPGGQRFSLPAELCVEGDWSNAAPFLCMGALSPEGVAVRGLRLDSAQGDRAVLDILRRFGAEVEEADGAVTVRRATLHGCTVDAEQTPDLVPPLAALAACAEGETRIVNAACLRAKESDRLQSTAAMLTALGADVAEQPDGLMIRGKTLLAGGTADAANDHRIAMAAAVAACACERGATINGAECVEKSYPAFWEDFRCLSM